MYQKHSIFRLALFLSLFLLTSCGESLENKTNDNHQTEESSADNSDTDIEGSIGDGTTSEYSQTPNIPKETGDIQRGETLYKDTELQCMACHDEKGLSPVFPLSSVKVTYSHSSSPNVALSLSEFIDTWMPAGKNTNLCSGDCAQDIAAYIRSWNPETEIETEVEEDKLKNNDLPIGLTGELVSVYSKCDYLGEAINLRLGSFTDEYLSEHGLKNNSIASFKVPSGYRATFYDEQLSGTNLVTTNNNACLSGSSLNQKISSVKIEINDELININTGQTDYKAAKCANCHGDDGQGIQPITIASCAKTDCTDVNILAQFIAKNMPVNSPSSCDLTDESVHTSCAATTAVFIANDFMISQVITPIVKKASTPIARLTNEEFVTSAMTLLNISSTPAIETAQATLSTEADIFGLLNDSSTQQLTHVALAGYLSMVDALVDEFFNGVESFEAMQAKYNCRDTLYSCGITFTSDLTSTAFRRKLTAQDTSEITTLFDTVTADYVAEDLNQWSIEAHQLRFRAAMYYTFLSPDFLLMIEQGTNQNTGDNGVAGSKQLSSREIANRMAFFLTGNLPDAELLTVAETGLLGNADTRLEQANRLLNSPHAEQQIANILTAWLAVDTTTEDTTANDAFNAFILDWVSNNRAFSALYQAPISVEHTDGTNSNELMGVLGLKAFVASHTNYPTPSFITRGEFVVSRLLCEQLPDDIPADALASEGLTPIEVFETHAQDECATCHRVFDNYGGAFQQFDGETSLFNPVNTDFGSSFDLFDIGDVSSIVANVSELSTEMALSNKAPSCMTELWYRHAFRRSIDTNDTDENTLAALITQWQSSGTMDIKSLLAAIVQLDDFVTLYE